MTPGRRRFLRVTGGAAVAAAAGAALGCAAGRSRNRRLGFAIDARRCASANGCVDCIRACHRTHNVPDIPDVGHEVKWIWKEPFERALAVDDPQVLTPALRGLPVPVFCNHCDNPPCVRVCPTQATWRRPDGIVMMDWHRCIGCRYCVAGCPYGSRSFNWEDPRPYLASPDPQFPTRTKGVVEKCTLCEERLDKKQLPACVEACQEKAMLFGDLNDPESEVRKVLRSHFAIRRKPALGTNPAVYYLV